MKVETTGRVWQAAKQLALSLAVLALVTLLCFALGFDSTPAAFLYLITILLLSLTVSFQVLAALSLLAVAGLNSFFDPSNGWTSGTPLDTIELVAFLLTAFVITRVVDRARHSDQGLAERVGLLDLTHDAVCITSMDDRLIYWNRGAEELYGWSADEAIGRMAHELLQTTSHEPIANVAGQLLRTGSWQGELFNVTRAGERIVVAARSVLQRDAEGNPGAHLVVANDITQRKRAEEALRRSEEQWRAVFEHNPTMYFMLDPAGTVLSVNRFGAEQLGYTVEELVGRSVAGVFHEDDAQAAKDHVAACLAHPGEALSWELRKIRKDGSTLWVRETARAMQRADGGPIVLVACEDITQRKQAEGALRASEGRFRTLVDHATDGIFLHGEDGVLIDVNRQACESLGYTRDELIGMSAFDIDPDLDPGAIGKRFEVGEPIVTFESRNRRKDGTTFPVEVRTRGFTSPDGRPLGLTLARDVTERNRAEVVLRESEERYRALIEVSPQMVWMADADGKLVFVNQWWCDYTGLTLDESEPEFAAVAPEHRDRLTESWQQSVASGGEWNAEAPLRRAADGQYRWHLTRARPVRDTEGRIVRWMGIAVDIHDRREAEEALRRNEFWLSEAQRVSRTGSWVFDLETEVLKNWSPEMFRMYGFDPDEGIPSTEAVLERIHPEDRAVIIDAIERKEANYARELRIVLPDGTLRHVQIVSNAALDAAGRPIETVGTMMDITERKQAEDALRQTQAALTHVTRVATVGEVTGSLAHELNQPLGAIANNANACLGLLSGEKPDADEARRALADIVGDAERASAIIDRVRALAKRSVPEQVELQLGEVVRDVLALAAAESAARHVTIRTDVAADLPVVMGDRVQLQQVLLNLVVNAMDAMSDIDDPERTVEIRGASAELDGRAAVRISVRDHGAGVRAEDAERLFEPFYTTKPHGMGLGLAISRSIIQAHGGTLWAEADGGPGATCSFALPARRIDPSM